MTLENLKQNIAPLSPNKQTIKLLLCTKPQNISSLVTIIVSICENNCYLYGSKQTAIATARVAYHHKRATHHDTKATKTPKSPQQSLPEAKAR